MATGVDIKLEVKFKTARSGGKGGQHVNKVETMVEGFWNVEKSALLTQEQKELVKQKLSNKINLKGILFVKSQSERTQLGNKEEVIKKMNLLVNHALWVPKKRKATKVPKAVIEKRIEGKKLKAQLKQGRKKIELKNL